MKPSILSFVAAFLLVLWGCSGDSPATSTSPVAPGTDEASSVNSTEYMYTGYSSGGTVIVRGYITLSFAEAGRVSGRWELRAFVDPSRIGPQTGRGSLIGTLSNGVLSIDLNPSFADNNVILTGRF